MSAEGLISEKVCGICGEDCSGRPRTKDAKGQYYCMACYEDAKRRQKARASRPKPHARRPKPVDDGLDMLAALADAQDAAPAIEELRTCGGCNMPLDRGVVVCTRCGYNMSTGRRAPAPKVVAAAKPKKAPKSRSESRSAAATEVGTVVGALGVGLPVLILGGLFLMAMQNPEGALLYFAVQGLYAVVVAILVLVAAFRHSVGTGFMTLCVPFFALYFVYSVNQSPGLKLMFTISLVSGSMGAAFGRPGG